MTKAEILKQAKVIWDYHLLHQPLQKTDCILVMGSNDLRVAEYGTKLYLDGWAPLIIFSGKVGKLTKGMWHKSEAEIFADVALKMGVPKEAIMIEPEATNTSENILFSQKLLKKTNLNPQTFIVVQKPYMERRAYATFQKVWPEKKQAIVSSPPLTFEQYPDNVISAERLIHIMVGDLQRTALYAKKGFMIPQEIPDEVWEAYQKLVKAGYTAHLVEE